ncbi:MAG: ketohexokinase [Gammaproteobacteria bacterium]|nr:ketohexokinase [Gammaproteobacteria bacterium]
MARILAVGIATLDIVCQLDTYPPEDAKLRANDRRITRGGNAANTLCVLGQLGHDCCWAGTVASDPAAADVLADLEYHGIDTSACRKYPLGCTPTSYVWRCLDTGSRTIVHYRDLPEYDSADFERIPLAGFDWLHFEGRNVEETARMMAHAAATRPDLPRSLEVEKYRPGIEALFEEATVLVFSRDYAGHAGFSSPEALVAAFGTRCPGASVVCTWGDQGAWGCAFGERPFHIPAFTPERIVDTLGAGDTFNAGLIDGLVGGRTLTDAVTQACRLAGRKCGQEGFRLT